MCCSSSSRADDDSNTTAFGARDVVMYPLWRSVRRHHMRFVWDVELLEGQQVQLDKSDGEEDGIFELGKDHNALEFRVWTPGSAAIIQDFAESGNVDQSQNPSIATTVGEAHVLEMAGKETVLEYLKFTGGAFARGVRKM